MYLVSYFHRAKLQMFYNTLTFQLAMSTLVLLCNVINVTRSKKDKIKRTRLHLLYVMQNVSEHDIRTTSISLG